MNRAFVAASFIPRTSLKRLTTTEVSRGKADLSAVKKKQSQFQANNDIPVYLKGGTMDYVVFFTSVGLLAVSLAAAAKSIYTLATKK